MKIDKNRKEEYKIARSEERELQQEMLEKQKEEYFE